MNKHFKKFKKKELNSFISEYYFSKGLPFFHKVGFLFNNVKSNTSQEEMK